jgi:hypothetical protein
MGNGWYILNKKHEIVPTDSLTATRWLCPDADGKNDNRRVAYTKIGDVQISTVFLGLDHSFDDGPPLVFETMIFGGEHNEGQWRYHAWQEALEGHEAAIKLVLEP